MGWRYWPMVMMSHGSPREGSLGIAWAVVVARHAYEVVEELEDLVLALADADHDAGLGDGALRLDAAEQLHRALVARAGAHGGVAPAHGLEVVGDDLGLRVDHHLEGGLVALEIADEDLDGHPGARLADADDRLGPDARAAVGQVVAVHARDDDVLEPQRRGATRRRVAARPCRPAGGLPVLTLQNPQARVHVSPRIIMVATPRSQHSPMLGHEPPLRKRCGVCGRGRWTGSSRKPWPAGSLALSHSGFCVWG